MWNRMLAWSLGLLLVLFSSAPVLQADDSFAALDLISSDVAFCLEIPALEKTWASLEGSPLMDRLRAFPVYQRFFEHRWFEQWQTLEDHVEKSTGQKLSAQLRALFAKNLVLAIYVSPEGIPKGIMLGEAADPIAIKMAIATWNKLEPNELTVTKSHRGQRYRQRKRNANAEESIYFASSEQWFAISDHESLIQDVIERFVAATAASPQTTNSDSLRLSNRFLQNRERLKKTAAAYIHIDARQWDQVLEESSRGMDESINPAAIWKHISSVSGCLQFDRGVVCDALIEMDKSNLPATWPQFVTTASSAPSWKGRIPAEAMLAVSGHLELAPFISLTLKQIRAADLAELSKIRRMAQSLLGGQELFDVVLPALARDFCGFVVTRPDHRTNRVVLDGMLSTTLDSSRDTKILQDVGRGLETTLNLMAAYFSVECQDVVTVNGEQKDSTQLRWLSETAPFPVAYGMKERSLVVAGSQECLRQSLETQTADNSLTRLTDHSRRYFPDANQLLWIDTARARVMLERNGADIANFFALGSPEEAKRWLNRFEQAGSVLQLVDSLFFVGRVDSDYVRITFGGGLDGK